MTTGINYLDETWPAVTGCSGKGCKAHCWVPPLLKRFPAIHQGPFNKVQFHPDRLDKPLHWKKPRRVGVCFTGDLFDDQVERDWKEAVYKIIEQCPQHDFFFLTKQINNFKDAVLTYIDEHEKEWLDNAYSGVSITDQDDADRMLPELLRIPGKHWVSYEPALSSINVSGYLWTFAELIQDEPKLRWGTIKRSIDWFVMGVESGHLRRQCDNYAIPSVTEQCKADGIPVWVKQININGKVEHDINKFPPELQVRQLPERNLKCQ